MGCDLAKGFGWDSHHHEFRFVNGEWQTALKAQRVRQLDSRKEALIAPGAANLLQAFRVMAPQRDRVLSLLKQPRQRCAPGSGAKHSDLHEADGVFDGGVGLAPKRLSLPSSSRLMLARC